jgi:hypothetical protein
VRVVESPTASADGASRIVTAFTRPGTGRDYSEQAARIRKEARNRMRGNHEPTDREAVLPMTRWYRLPIDSVRPLSFTREGNGERRAPQDLESPMIGFAGSAGSPVSATKQGRSMRVPRHSSTPADCRTS